MALLGALLLLALAQAVPALGAAADYTGGPQAGDYPLYVANDHTVYALRLSAGAGTLLDSAGAAVTAPGAQYYVKLRISPTAKPSGGTSRGFIWNATTQQWAQERAAWSDFPVVATGTGGAIIAGNTWWYFKFGDVTKPGVADAATWYLIVSLKPIDGADQTTQNNATPPPVTITDMTGALPGALTSAFRIHNGAATGATDARRIEATNSGGTDVWSLSRTENNQVAQGYGSDATGDFELGVPVGLAFDARIQSVLWPALASSFTGSLADVDIALGAADTTPPIAPSALTATAGDGHVQLSWPAVADASAYTVYKWQAATPIGGSTNYTPQHMAAATVADDDVRRDRPDQRRGVLLRGPRQRRRDQRRPADGHTGGDAEGRLGAHAADVRDDGQVGRQSHPYRRAHRRRRAVHQRAAGAPGVVLRRFLLDSCCRCSTRPRPYAYGVAVQPTRKTMYQLVFEGDASHAAATSPAVTVTPKVKLGKPHAPSSVKKGKQFTAYGDLTPKPQPAATRSRSSATRRSPASGSSRRP